MSSVYYTSIHYLAVLYCLSIRENTLNQITWKTKTNGLIVLSETMNHSKKLNSPCETLSNHVTKHV